jgi:hypothetical protein
VLVELGIMIGIIFIPELDKAFFAYGYQPIEFFWFFLLAAFCLIAWGELRKYIIRQYPTSWFAYAFAF